MTLRLTTQFACVLALLAWGPACHRSSPSMKQDNAEFEAELDMPIDRPEPGPDLFDPPSVLALTIEVAPTELEAMLRGSHAYGRCTLREGGVSLTDVGLRYKGNPASESASGKPDFTVDFNEFVSGQEFHGAKRMILLAARDDPSYLSAPIGLELFREAGVPAARCTFARIQFNGRDLGPYLLVEGVDRDFIRRHFAKNKGNLYDEGVHTDVDGRLEKYGAPESAEQPDVDALAAAAKLPDPIQRWQQLQLLLDVDRFVTFTALEVLLWQKDSYAIKARKFRIYHDPTTDRMVFFPKNVEEVFDKTDGPLIPEWRGVVARAVLTTPEGQAQYRKTVARLMETVFKPSKIQARAREVAAIIRPAVGTNAQAARKFDGAVAQFCDAADQRTRFVAQQLKTPPKVAGQ